MKSRVALVALVVVAFAQGISCGRSPKQVESDPIDIQLGTLKKFGTGRDLNLLVQHLSADAKWELKPVEDGLLAEQGWDLDGAVSFGPHELIGFDGQDRLRFSSIRATIFIGPEHPFKTKGATVLACDAETVQVKLDPPAGPGQNWFTSSLIVEAEGVSLSIRERSLDKGRALTEQVLSEVREELEQLWEGREEMQRHGYVEGIVHGLSVVNNAKPTADVSEFSGRGSYKVTAYVNGGEEGYAYLKVYRTADDKQLLSDSAIEHSRTCVGWSTDGDSRFLYAYHILVRQGAKDEEYEARFEVWFHPVAGGDERKLVAATVMVYGFDENADRSLFRR